MLQRKTKVLLLMLVTFVILVTLKKATPQTESDFQRIVGFWEGEFMPGNNFTLILTFQKQKDGSEMGRVLLFQGEVQIQDDILSNITLDKNQLSFLIEAKNTPFKGRIDADSLEIVGDFQFPDGSVYPVKVKKVMKPSLGDFTKKREELHGINILKKRYSVAQLQNDFDFLRRQLETTHPKLYFFTSRETFAEIFENTFHSIEIEMTEGEFFRIIAPVVAKVNCSHTGIRPSNEFTKAINNQRNLIPLDIRFLDEKAFIITNYSQSSEIEAGMQVLSINGIPTSEILKKLVASIPSDGFNKTYKLYEINTNFPHVYSLYIGNFEQFDLECLTSAGDKIGIKVPAQTSELLDEAIRHAHPERYPAQTLPLRLQINSEINTAILSVKGFWAPNFEEYNTFLHNSFSRMDTENIRRLIIDLRGNKGGHPFFAAELLSYLARSDFTYFELPKEQGEFAPLYQPIKCKENGFNGDVYILINGGCLSSTGHFLSLVKYHQLATLIGEESGGSFYCNDRSTQLTMPETKIILNLPQATFQTAVTGFKIGDPLLPDHVVKPKLEDLLKGRDTELEFALQLIKIGDM